ncbi:MAG: phosphatase PAP2 family protein [Peptococcaceae bacterium]|nr:phosphatase PAP2 family protein [Peptococcaceae bacterium]
MEFALFFDWPMLAWIQTHLRGEWLDAIVPQFSSLGNKGFVWMVLALILVCVKKYRPIGIYMLVGMLLGLVIGNGLLKHLVARPRPIWLDPSIAALIPVPTDYSFPSGHTLSSVISATVLCFSKNRGLAILGVSLAVLMGLSRLYLYVHFPSDVLAGAALGILIGVCTVRLGDKIRQRRGKMTRNHKN